MDQAYLEGLAKNVSDGPTPFVNIAQLQAEIVEERHVSLGLPVAERHLNHVGIAYAGSEFVLAEIAGGTLFMATYGTDEFVPIFKGVELKFVKPGTKDLVRRPVAHRGGGRAEDRAGARARTGRLFPGGGPVLDVDGEQVAQFDFNYYALPAKK